MREKTDHFRLFLFASLIVLGGCGIYETKNKAVPNNEISALGNANGRLSFAQVNAAVIQPNCVGCHRSGNAKGDVQLDSFEAVQANLAGIKEEAVVTGEMPPKGALSPSLRTALQRWIEQGAPRDADVNAPAVTLPSPSPVADSSPQAATPVPSETPIVTETPVVSGTPVVSPTPNTGSAPVLVATYQSIRDQVFLAKCMKCHVAGATAEDFPLDTYEKTLAQGEMVIPGNAEGSSIVNQIERGKMPPKRSGISPVTAEELEAIKAWITNGAKP